MPVFTTHMASFTGISEMTKVLPGAVVCFFVTLRALVIGVKTFAAILIDADQCRGRFHKR